VLAILAISLSMGLELALSASTRDAVESSGTPQATEPDQTPSEVLAKVNGELLYVEDVASVLNEIHSGVQSRNRTDFDLDAMIFRLINDTLFAQEARILGFDKDETIQRKVAALREGLATGRLEYEEILSKIKLDPAEVEKSYNDVFRTATIRIATRKDKTEAEELRREIDSGADMGPLARERSEDPYSARGGLMTDVPWIDLPGPVADLTFSMSPGEIAGPVATGLGWTVFRVEELEPADPERFEQRRGQVRDVLRFRQDEALRDDLLHRLRETHDVTVDEKTYESIGVELMQDGRLLPEIENPDAIVVTAGGRAITASAFGRALAERWQNIANPDVALAIKPILLDRMTVDQLLVAEAYRLGYDKLPEIERRAKALETRLLVKQYMRDVVATQVEVDRQALEAYYADHRDQFRKPPLLFISQMTLSSSDEAARMIDLLRQGTEFAWLARKHSTDGFAKTGGSVGWIKANEGISEFQNDLADAEVGEILGPKGAGKDWRILKVGAIEDQGRYSFVEVSGNVRERVEEREFFALVDKYVERLRERSEIWVDQDAVASLQISAEPKEEEEGHSAPGHGGV
jgi:peptidyl-prolyl cis-trans isomerase C